MTNTTTTFQCSPTSFTSTPGQHPPVNLNGHSVQLHPGSVTPRAQTTQAGKWLHDMTDQERQAFLRRKGVKTVEPVKPDPINKTQTSQGALQRGFLGAVYDNTLGVLESALAEDEAKPQTVKPAALSKPAVSGRFDDFLKDVEADFKCFHQGEPCKKLVGSLKGKIILVGWSHDDDVGIGSVRNLLAKHLNKETDYLVAEMTPSEFQGGDYVDRLCMGIPKERCIAGDLEGGLNTSTAATHQAIAAAAKLAVRLDPGALSEIARRAVGQRSAHTLLHISQEVIDAKYRKLSAKQKRALNGLDQAYFDAINRANEATVLELRNRERHMRDMVMDNLPDQNSTLFVALGGLHVDYLARGLERDVSVLELYPQSSYELIQLMVRTVRHPR